VVTEPRWLDDDEMRLWRAFLEASGGLAQALDAALKYDAGLDLGDYEVLVHLSEAPERRLRMSDLSSHLLHSQSRVTQRIGRLSRRGLVSRRKCEMDRRVTYAVLTDAGLAALEAAAPDHVAQVRRHFLDHVSPDEQEAMISALERMVTGLRFRGRIGRGSPTLPPAGP
jgi:DNA-binding MarR family transcriptional regulator